MYQIVSSAKSREMCDFGSTELRESTPLEVVVRNRVLGQHEQKPPMKLTLRQKVIILALTFVVILITPGIIIGTTSKKDVISTESIVDHAHLSLSLSTTSSAKTSSSTVRESTTVIQEINECSNYTVLAMNITSKGKVLLCNQDWMGDGICDDMCNTLEFQFDQGDCCLANDKWNTHCDGCQCYCPLNSEELEPSENPMVTANPEWPQCYAPPEEPLHLDLDSICHLMIGDELCDDLCNHPEQNFDGGDCCLDFIEVTYCNDCFCYSDCSHHMNERCVELGTYPNAANDTNCKLNWIADGFCDDVCNFSELDFDGGDCCKDVVINEFCSDCFCYDDCTHHEKEYASGFPWYTKTTSTMSSIVQDCYAENEKPITTEVCKHGWKGDGFCDEACNVPEEHFDKGDCCLDLVSSDFCSNCFCYEDCTFHNMTSAMERTLECYVENPMPPHNWDTCGHSFIGDGICDDSCNSPDFEFDGEDCCTSITSTDWCSFCFCYQQCTSYL